MFDKFTMNQDVTELCSDIKKLGKTRNNKSQEILEFIRQLSEDRKYSSDDIESVVSKLDVDNPLIMAIFQTFKRDKKWDSLVSQLRKWSTKPEQGMHTSAQCISLRDLHIYQAQKFDICGLHIIGGLLRYSISAQQVRACGMKSYDFLLY